MFCLFLASPQPAALELPACRAALRHTPARAHDPYLNDGAPPAQVLQLYFDSLAGLEAAAGALGGPWSAQAMAVHRFPVREGSGEAADGPRCTYLVAYEGPAEDEAAWHAEYLAHHVPLMASLPGLRELEVYTPIDWRCPGALERVRYLQRNKVVFDGEEALSAALSSPVRSAMRAHFRTLPAFAGRVTHYAMASVRLVPPR